MASKPKTKVNDQKQKPWYQMNRQQVLGLLESRHGGLTGGEVKDRFEKYGPNQLPSEPPLPWVTIILNQFKSPLVYVLLVAAIISYLIGEYFDVVIIMIAVSINTIIGFWQEYKADRTISKLKQLVEFRVTVERDGKEQQIYAHEVVPGDIMILEAGDKISADARLLEANSLQTNEASLTGESFPVNKHTEEIPRELSIGDRVNMVYLGTVITRGRGRAVVTETGINTEIGKIAELVSETEEEKTPLQRQIAKVSKLLAFWVIVAALIVIIVGNYQGMELMELLVIAAALAVAAIPESLLIALTLVLVVGMQKILKRKALVRNLLAAETLGSVSIVCADKTGTITQGIMKADRLQVGGSVLFFNQKVKTEEGSPEFLALKAVALCNNAYAQNPKASVAKWQLIGDPTETALLKASLDVGLDREKMLKQYPRLDEIPFNEVYKFMATMHFVEGDAVEVFVKGAPETILDMCGFVMKGNRRCKIDARERKEIEAEYRAMASQGLRVLGIAHSNHPKSVRSFDKLVKDREDPKLRNLCFLGWIGLLDPIRPNVAQAFQTLKKAGIRTVIITGDHRFTVKALVNQLGKHVTDDRILEGIDLDKMDDGRLYEMVPNIDIYARVEPKHKLRIVKAWKKRNHVVAMLGDGVNDAPALKASDIGVAVGDATDVAKEASDMIVARGDLSVIEAAVREGRVIFDNIRKIYLYLVADSFTEIILILLALLTNYPMPLAAVQILWINIISDGLPDLALTMEPGEKDVMDYPPRPKDEPIINREVIMLIATITAVAVTVVFSIFVLAMDYSGDLDYVRTVVFTAFAIDSIIYVFSVKSLRKPIWKINIFNNKWLLGAVSIAIAAQLAVVYIPALQKLFKTVPLGLFEWMIIVGFGLAEIAFIEIVKWSYWHVRRIHSAIYEK